MCIHVGMRMSVWHTQHYPRNAQCMCNSYTVYAQFKHGIRTIYAQYSTVYTKLGRLHTVYAWYVRSIRMVYMLAVDWTGHVKRSS